MRSLRVSIEETPRCTKTASIRALRTRCASRIASSTGGTGRRRWVVATYWVPSISYDNMPGEAMSRDEFADLVARTRMKHPIWFDLETDVPLDPSRQGELEARLGAQLPEDYVWFLQAVRQRTFAFATVYSADEASDLFVLRNQDGRMAGRTVRDLR